MRFLTGTATASLIIAGAFVFAAAPASADDIYFNHAKGTMSGSDAAPAPEASAPSKVRHQAYMQIEPRDMKVDPNATKDAEGESAFFNHAKGTMSPGSVESADSSVGLAGDQNGRYTASYHQPYMQIEPRDMKADPNALSDTDGSNVYFNHAKGTMSGN